MKNSIQMLHLFIFGVLFSFFLEIFHLPFALKPVLGSSLFHILWLVTSGLILGLKLVFYGGAYGILVELVAGQEKVITLKRFQANAKQYWKIYALVILAYALSYVFLAYNWIFYCSVRAFTDLSIMVLLLFKIVVDKYQVSPKERKFTLSLKDALNISGLFLVYLALYLALGFFAYSHQVTAGMLSLLLVKYIHFLLYIHLAFLYIGLAPEIKERIQSQPV